MVVCVCVLRDDNTLISYLLREGHEALVAFLERMKSEGLHSLKGQFVLLCMKVVMLEGIR